MQGYAGMETDRFLVLLVGGFNPKIYEEQGNLEALLIFYWAPQLMTTLMQCARRRTMQRWI